MNILQIQDQLKNLSQDQLVREMQMPSGSAPQYLVLSELTRRKKMQTEMAAQQQKGPQQTVAQEAVAAAGVPQAGLPQLAAAMAPKTDITGNTGAMPAQQILPEAPVGMADGGYVQRMQGGSFAGAVFTDPALRVMANRMGMSVQEYLSSVDPAEAERIVQGAEQRASRDRMVGFDPVGEGIGMPTQADLDRRYTDELYGLPAARPMELPTADTPPVLPTILADTVGQPPAGIAVLPAVPDMPSLPDSEPSPAVDNASSWWDILSPLNEVGEGYRATAQNARAEAERQAKVDAIVAQLQAERGAKAAEAAQWMDDRDAAAQDKLDRTAYIMSQLQAERAAETRPESNRQQAYNELQTASESNPLARLLGDVYYGLSGETNEEYAARKAAEDPMTAAAEQSAAEAAALRDEAGITESLKTDAEKAAAAEAARKANETASKTATDTPDAPPGDGGGDGAGSGGSGGSGGASGLSSYEQEITDAIARSEKRAEQDKWLALAQTGLEIMNAAAKQGTFAGAVGEGGTKGLAAFRQGRDEAEATRLGLLKELEGSRLARAQLAARGGGGGKAYRPPAAILSSVEGQLAEVNSALGALQPQSDGWIWDSDPDRAARMRLETTRDALLAQRNYILQMHGVPTFDTSSDGTISGLQDQ